MACGAQFTPRNRGHRFCSSACRYRQRDLECPEAKAARHARWAEANPTYWADRRAAEAEGGR